MAYLGSAPNSENAKSISLTGPGIVYNIDGLAAGSRPADSHSKESIPLGASLNPLDFHTIACTISAPWNSTLGPSSGFSRKYVYGIAMPHHNTSLASFPAPSESQTPLWLCLSPFNSLNTSGFPWRKLSSLCPLNG
jgi:hypothetical protein